jgi:hypothetical protein
MSKNGAHSVNGRLDVVARKEAQTITSINSQAVIHRLDPFPIARFRVLDLQSRNRLAEEQGDSTAVSVATGEKLITKKW